MFKNESNQNNLFVTKAQFLGGTAIESEGHFIVGSLPVLIYVAICRVT